MATDAFNATIQAEASGANLAFVDANALLNLLKDYPNSVIGIPFSEHVPDLTEKKDIAVVKEYLKKFYPQLNWNEN